MFRLQGDSKLSSERSQVQTALSSEQLTPHGRIMIIPPIHTGIEIYVYLHQDQTALEMKFS